MQIFDLYADPDQRRFDELVEKVQTELDGIREVLPVAIGYQWEQTRVPCPRDEQDRRAGGGMGDPTADAALDPSRERIREQVLHCEYAMRRVTTLLEAVRRGLEASVSW